MQLLILLLTFLQLVMWPLRIFKIWKFVGRILLRLRIGALKQKSRKVMSQIETLYELPPRDGVVALQRRSAKELRYTIAACRRKLAKLEMRHHYYQFDGEFGRFRAGFAEVFEPPHSILESRIYEVEGTRLSALSDETVVAFCLQTYRCELQLIGCHMLRLERQLKELAAV